MRLKRGSVSKLLNHYARLTFQYNGAILIRFFENSIWQEIGSSWLFKEFLIRLGCPAADVTQQGLPIGALVGFQGETAMKIELNWGVKRNIVVSVFLLIVSAILAVMLWVGPWIAMSVSVTFVGAFVLQGLKRLPTKHVGLVTIFGERVPEVRKEGLRFFPFYPFWYGFVLIKTEKVNQDLPPQKVRTPDLVELLIPVSLTTSPDAEDPRHLIEYDDAGGEEGTADILEDIVQERLREWAFSQEEGPRDFRDCMGAKEEAVMILLKAIVGDQLPRVHERIPTSVLYRHIYYGQDLGRWKNEWESMSADTQAEIRQKLEERREAARKVREGNSELVKSGIGLKVYRLNIGEITPLGPAAEAMDLEAKERLERKGEKEELEHVLERATVLMKPKAASEGKEGGLGLSAEQALELIQTERGKVTKSIDEKKISISSETGNLLQTIARTVGVFFGKQGGAQ